MNREGGAGGPEPEPQTEKTDPVKHDMLWQIHADRKWEKKWGFLKTHDLTGKPKKVDPLPSDVSLYSDCFPNTSNQTYGSRLFTPLGRELTRLDRSLFWSKTHQHNPQTSRGESANASE